MFRSTHEVIETELIRQNRFIVSTYSGLLAKVYKDTFESFLVKDETMEPYRQYIKIITDHEEPLVDSYGRKTYFYTQIGGH